MKRAAIAGLVIALAAGSGVYLWRQDSTGAADEARQTTQGGGSGRRGAGARRSEGPPAVLTAPAAYADVPVTLVSVGTAQALQTVLVRPQVGGKLLELTFREGQEVKKGDALARIDPTIYQAQYEQALAKKAQDEANLNNAKADLARYTKLGDYATRQQTETQAATVAQLTAQLTADQAAIDNAKAFLDYTTIMAPIEGRTGIRLIDQGNILSASDPAGIVVITQLRPITVLFNLAQQNLRAVNAAAAAGPVTVEALDADNRTVLDRGRLEVVDNQVDQTTGTVKIKATFPNESQQLWPGQFVNVRLTLDTIRNAVVVPSAAVQRGPNGAFVYGLADDRAVMKKVEVGRQEETISVIASGVTPPERVITSGFARLTDGDRVRVVEQPVADATDAAPADPGRFNEERRTRLEAVAGPGERPGGDRPRRRRQEGHAAPGSGAAPGPNASAAGPARTE